MIPAPFRRLHSWWRGPQTPPAAGSDPLPGIGTSRLGDLSMHREAWQTVEGLRRPDWRKIGEFIRGRTADKTELAAMWHDASLQWLCILQQDLGGSYRIDESRYCLLLSARSAFSAKYLVRQCDSILLHLLARLKEAAWRWPHGKHVVLLFEEEDEYYRYISHFFDDGGEYGTSSGISIGAGYRHTALPTNSRILVTLAHEFVHLYLSHHAGLPKWINEGLANHLSGELLDPRSREFDLDSAKAQRTFWTPGTIQGFWSGTAFRVDEERKMSYNLAERLIVILSREFGDLSAFVRSAQRDDGGESAAREHLGISLGELAAAVLGDGDWQPLQPSREEVPGIMK